MKREFLAGLGLEKEVIDKIMAEHGTGIESLKSSHKAEMDTANSTIAGLRADIKKFDGTDIEALKKSAKDWEDKYNSDIAAEKARADKLVKEHALKDALKAAGVNDPDYLIYKHGGVDKFAFSDKNEVLGLEDTIKPYRESSPGVFDTIDSDGSLQSSQVVINTGSSNGNTGGASTDVNAYMNGLIRGATK